MAVDKDKVIASIQATTEGAKLPKTLVAQFAAKWGERIDKDEDIEEFVKNNLDSLIIAASYADNRVTDALKKKPSEKPKEPETPAKTDEDGDPVLKALTALTDRIDRMEKGNTQKSIQERFRQDPRLKDFPEKLFKGRYPETEEGFEEAAADMVETFKDYADFSVAQSEGGTSGTPGTPPKPKGNEQVKPASEEQLKDLAAMWKK